MLKKIFFTLPVVFFGLFQYFSQTEANNAVSNISSWLFFFQNKTLIYPLILVVLIYLGLYINYYAQKKTSNIEKNESSSNTLPQQDHTPSVLLLISKGQIDIHNKGNNEIYLHGDKFSNQPKDVEAVPRIIPVNCLYYILTDKLEKQAQNVIGLNGEKLEAFEVYLSDKSKNHYIARFKLLLKMENGILSIHAQQLGVSKEKWQ